MADITIQEVRRQLIDGLESEYTPNQIKTIEIRLGEIAKENNLSLKELNEYCWANSSEMFACIFNGKEFEKENFEVE